MFFNPTMFTPRQEHQAAANNNPPGPKDIGGRDITKLVLEKGRVHKNFEKKLWMANLFIIPLIVYPIVSLLGHAILELTTHRENRAYGEIANYLDDKYSVMKEKFSLRNEDLKYMSEVFKKYKLRSDYLPLEVDTALIAGNENAFYYGFKR